MTVQSLINLLSVCNPDAEVVFVPHDGDANIDFVISEDIRAGVVCFIGEPDVDLPDEEEEDSAIAMRESLGSNWW